MVESNALNYFRGHADDDKATMELSKYPVKQPKKQRKIAFRRETTKLVNKQLYKPSVKYSLLRDEGRNDSIAQNSQRFNELDKI